MNSIAPPQGLRTDEIKREKQVQTRDRLMLRCVLYRCAAATTESFFTLCIRNESQSEEMHFWGSFGWALGWNFKPKKSLLLSQFVWGKNNATSVFPAVFFFSPPIRDAFLFGLMKFGSDMHYLLIRARRSFWCSQFLRKSIKATCAGSTELRYQGH